MGYFKDLATVYTTTRLVRIRSPFIAILNTVLVILVWCSFLGSIRLDIAKIYQSSCPVNGVILSKVKGFASTEDLTDEDLNIPNATLYRRTWDPADIIYPSQGGEGETGSFTIVTNLVITPNQTLSTCAEEPKVAPCKNDSDCKTGFWSARTHGVLTGKCVDVNNETGTCEIRGWCPIELRRLPRSGKKPLLEDVKDFTVMLKNSVEFPDCGNQQGSNIPKSMPQEYLKSCNFHKITDPLCPIFKIGDIVKWSGDDFSKIAVMGGVYRILVNWECDFDFGRAAEDCKPKYDFVRVDDREAGVSRGWNFRSAEFYAEDLRTLKKQFGLKILIDLNGEGRRFDFFQLVITLGATIGLFSVAPLACDFLLDMFNMLCKSRSCGGDASSSFHDHTMSCYDVSDCEEDIATAGNGVQSHNRGVANLGMSTSSMSINNESFKQIPE